MYVMKWVVHVMKRVVYIMKGVVRVTSPYNYLYYRWIIDGAVLSSQWSWQVSMCTVECKCAHMLVSHSLQSNYLTLVS